MRIKIWPYKMGSAGAKALARLFPTLRVYPNRHYRPRPNHLVVNWGNSSFPAWYEHDGHMLNIPTAVARAANKLKTFQAFLEAGVPHPEWSVDRDAAYMWTLTGHKVFCRQTLTGRSGRGIIISETPEQIVEAPLYTKAVANKHEYRIHVMKGEVIDYVQKKKLSRERRNVGDITVNPFVRNHSNGWIFAREGVVVSEPVRRSAVDAVHSLGLDFGAVDVCEDMDGKPYVFEVNTAPGLEGSTLDAYKNALRRLL